MGVRGTRCLPHPSPPSGPHPRSASPALCSPTHSRFLRHPGSPAPSRRAGALRCRIPAAPSTGQGLQGTRQQGPVPAAGGHQGCAPGTLPLCQVYFSHAERLQL